MNLGGEPEGEYRSRNLINQLLLNPFSIVIRHMASASLVLTAAAILQYQFINHCVTALIENRFAISKYSIFPIQSPQYMHGDIALEKRSVNHKTGVAVNGLVALQIEHNQVVVNDRTTSNMFVHEFGMFRVKNQPIL